MRAKLGAALDQTELVAEKRQLTFGGDGCVDLAQRAGGGVPGIDVELGLLAGLGGKLPLALVEPLERRQPQIDLASDFEQRWRVARQRLGDIGDRANIVGDVLADLAVAPSGALDEDTVLVAQRDGETIELQLDTEPGHRLTLQATLRSLIPAPQIVDVEGVVQRHHRDRVSDRRERLVDAAADPLGDRVRGDQLGIGLLECNELAVEPIPFGVGDLGGVEFVVLLGVVVEGRPQFVDAVGRRVSV